MNGFLQCGTGCLPEPNYSQATNCSTSDFRCGWSGELTRFANAIIALTAIVSAADFEDHWGNRAGLHDPDRFVAHPSTLDQQTIVGFQVLQHHPTAER